MKQRHSITQRLIAGFLSLQVVAPVFAASGGGGGGRQGPRQTHEANTRTSGRGLSCPEGLVKEVTQNDKYNGGFVRWYFGMNVASGCPKVVHDKSIQSSAELERAYQSNEFLGLPGAPDGMISSCIAKPRMVASGRANRLVTPNISVDDQKAVVSDYYWAMNRLSFQAKANIEAIGAMDNMLGKEGGSALWVGTSSNDAGHYIYDGQLPGTAEWAKKVQDDCKVGEKAGPGGQYAKSFDDTLNQVLAAHMALRKLAAERAKVGFVHPRLNDKATNEKRQRLAKIRGAEQQIKELSPWLKGKNMEKYADPNFKDWGVADLRADLQKQILANRYALMSKHKKLREAANCVNGSDYSSCGGEAGKTILKETSPLPVQQLIDYSPNVKDEAQRNANREAAFNMMDADCRFGIRTAIGEGQEALDDFKMNVAVTVATAGLGSYLTAAKAAVSAGQVAKVSTVARAAQLAMNITDVGFLAAGFKDTLKTCDENINQNLGGGEVATRPSAKAPACSSASRDELQAVADYRSCAIQAALAVAVGGAATGLGLYANLKKVADPIARLTKAGMTESAAKAAIADITRASEMMVERDGKAISSFFAKSQADRAIRMIDTLESVDRAHLGDPAKREAILNSMVRLDDLYGGKIKGKEAAAFINQLAGDADSLEGWNTVLRDAKKAMADGTAKTAKEALRSSIAKHPQFKPQDIEDMVNCALSSFAE